MSSKPRSAEWHIAAIRAKTIQQGDCWIWQGWVTHNGYGEKAYRGKTWRVHRLMYTLTQGPVSSGMDVCHSCDVRLCCNPAHLWVGTRKQNMEDCLAKERHDSMKRTHCPRGHEYTPENTYFKGPQKSRPAGARNCKVCQRIRLRIKAGWPLELAESLPAVAKGSRPVKARLVRNTHRESAP
jgi:hypothetical protein